MKAPWRKGRAGAFIAGCILLAATPASAQKATALAGLLEALQQGRVEVIDLTHALDEDAPYWPEGTSQSPFHAKVVATPEHDGYFARTLEIPEHFGTHMDAPAHFDSKGATIDRIPVSKLVVPAVVVDVRSAANSDPNYRVSAADLEAWEKVHGRFPQSVAILFETGWAARWPSEKEYMNQDAQGVMHFPGLSLAAARYLLEHAHPVAIGIDTGSIDYGPSKDFEVHHLTMSSGLYHLENLAGLERLPATGACLIALPLKLRGGSGSPARVVALVPRVAASGK